jgi:hypothetical protein
MARCAAKAFSGAVPENPSKEEIHDEPAQEPRTRKHEEKQRRLAQDPERGERERKGAV